MFVRRHEPLLTRRELSRVLELGRRIDEKAGGRAFGEQRAGRTARLRRLSLGLLGR